MLMNFKRDGSSLLGLCIVAVLLCCDIATGNVVFKVQHKYGGHRRATISELKAHDARRHGRNLVTVDFPLGGNAKVTDAALYYTKLGIGTPPKDYYLQVDTGSDILWVNCDGCNDCPDKSTLGLDLKTYDLKNSETGKQITCDQDFCSLMYDGAYANCVVGKPCSYAVTYADGSTAEGYFVADNITFDQVSGDLQTTNSMGGTFSFGCSGTQSGNQGTATERVDGIIGFGKANSSILSQLAESGKIKKIFSHCLNRNNGGIFAIGEVIEPKVLSTPLVAYENHYSIIMKKAEIGGEMIDIPTESFLATGRKTVIDSGATLAYLPDDVYNLLIEKVMSNHSNLKTYTVEQQFTCFTYKENVDDGFPAITLHFKNSLSLEVAPHEYLLNIHENEWCLGLHRGAIETDDGEKQILLGDIILANKLFVYDLENMTLGWTTYDCKSSIKVKDDQSGNAFSVGAHDISPPPSSTCRLHLYARGMPLIFFLLLTNLIAIAM